MNRFMSVVVVGLALAGVAHAENPHATGPAQTPSEAAGLKWTPPAEWTAQGERPMRVGTFTLPAAKGDAEPAELAIFYFGPGQGGGVEANVKRWVAQFQKPDGSSVLEKDSKTKLEKFGGFPTTMVEVKGTFTGGGPMMGPSTPKPGYRLLGAIVEGPEGALFFKLTGPEKTVAAADKPFRKMLEGLKKK